MRQNRYAQGIRNAIRSRSRTGRRSGESLELQALSSSEPKLRRMPRVESDDSQTHNPEVNNDYLIPKIYIF